MIVGRGVGGGAIAGGASVVGKPPAVNWYWETPIDFWEDWTGDGRSDVDGMFWFTYGEPGDLQIITLQMWMPSGDIPELVLGHWEGGAMVPDMERWTAFPAFSYEGIYVKSWWSWVTQQDIDDDIAGNLYNFSAPTDAVPGASGSTEGGNVFYNCFRTTVEPKLAYQVGVTGDLLTTPPQPPQRGVLHSMFGRRPNEISVSFEYPWIRPVGVVGSPGDYYTDSPQAMTVILEDNWTLSGESDAYGLGFYYSSADALYEGSLTWDMTVSEELVFSPGNYSTPLGPIPAVLQGIIIGDAGEVTSRSVSAGVRVRERPVTGRARPSTP